MDKELETQVAELTRRLSELEKPPVKVAEPIKVEVPKELTEAVGQIKELHDTNARFEARLKALEQAGTPQSGAGAPTKEITEPETPISFDKSTRTIRGMR